MTPERPGAQRQAVGSVSEDDSKGTAVPAEPSSGARSSDDVSSVDERETVDSLMRRIARVSHEDVARLTTQPSLETLTANLDQPMRMPGVGDVIGGRYELKELLGTGGMGAVFAARHRGTGREVAIKVLLPQRGRHKPERLARFVREANVAGRIRHPNVVDIYDVDGAADVPYIAMERLHGESLGERIKRGVLPAEEAVRVLVSAMHGVAEVHRQGVIHRDLKPDNIYLARSEGSAEPVPKVLDFGVSRIVVREGVEPHLTTLTRTGYVIGTPSYMPLEQLRGDPDIDARADVYALGVILYEALCGQRPYASRNDHELVIRMATEAPTPLRDRAPEVEPSLAALVAKALSKLPEDRFEDVESFAGALERWLAGERILATSPQVESKASARALRGRTLRRAVWLTALLAAGLSVWFLERDAPRLSPVAPAKKPASQITTSRPAPAIGPLAAPKPARETAIVSPPGVTEPASAIRRRRAPMRPKPLPSNAAPQDPAVVLDPAQF